jgi:hypothetical protein
MNKFHYKPMNMNNRFDFIYSFMISLLKPAISKIIIFDSTLNFYLTKFIDIYIPKIYINILQNYFKF